MSARQNFFVGLVSIVAVVAIAGLLLRFGELGQHLRPSYLLTARTNDATGLRPGSTVTLNGVPVGRVDSIALEPEMPLPVTIVLRIDAVHAIPATAAFEVGQSLLGGSASFALLARTADRALPTDGRGEVSGQARTTIDRLAGELDRRFEPLLNAVTAFERLSETYTQLGRQLNDLVAPGGPGTTDLRTAIDRATRLIEELSETAGLARDLLGDEELRGGLRDSIRRAEEMFEQAAGVATRIGETAGRVEQGVDELLGRVGPVSDELTSTLREVRELVRLGREGPGTMASLLNDPTLYRSLEETTRQLRSTLFEAELLILQIKAEGIKLEL